MHWLHAVLHLALVPTRSPAACGRSRRAQPVRMVGADLEGGENEQRNAALAALRRSFLASSAEEEERPSGEAEDASKLGLYLDVPVCRWGFPILPHHRTVLNVYQAQYTLAFEKLLATPEPWLYAHVMLPGGVDNLGNPDYALAAADSKAPRHGTLMQVVAVQRETDARLTLIVQGLSRGVALRCTQALPYARADFQLLPDDEMLLGNVRPDLYPYPYPYRHPHPDPSPDHYPHSEPTPEPNPEPDPIPTRNPLTRRGEARPSLPPARSSTG